MDNFYYRIALAKYESALSYDQKIHDYQNSGAPDYMVDMNTHAMKSEQAKQNVIAVVFSAMVLESFIFHYGVEHLGSNIVNKHLDRLDLASKWVVFPRMATSRTIDKSGRAFQSLKELIGDRNYLVHSKISEDRAGYSFELYEKVRIAAGNAIGAQELLLRELDELHDGKTHYADSTLCPNECFA